ncbi:DMT family transporter [Ralstonia solanacearum]|uniref:DMT family transporter n=1 Tax=Ralstonia solanacearum TaxID=305 RepID=UPI00202A4C35|nr:DMT family transporter [Ralstonia solanacearum]MCL9844788.1 DMT family transporter [Ralstonia solanacearum]MDC6252991.1 DMT family transporter [Ralstonia solanacearum]MDC6257573.1 DMT family transporter [Ralstonia solanacearum]MDC6301771.1 DMT family transporter [Ralstonia solanacearum]
MRRSDVIELLTLAALWGGSFLFMRVAAPLFGPVALIALRVAIASAFLLPVLAMRGGLGALRAQWPHLLAVGILNSAIPFCLFAYAELTLTAGFTSVLNAAAPLFAAIVAFVWLGERMSSWRVLGLAIGFVGVIVLVGGSSALDAGQGGLAVAAALGATVLYGLASSYTKRHLTGVPPLAVATGSQVAAAIVLAPLAVWLWPAHTPTGSVWFHVIGLGIACTGIAYILFFRLVAHVGPTRAVSVTFLIPVFGVLWGILFLDEPLTLNMVAGCAVILLGTSLSTGVLAPGKRANASAGSGASNKDSLLRPDR